MKRPSKEFVRDRLLIINNLNNSESMRQQAKEEIYKAFRKYQPLWNDDELSDVLSYYDEGILEKYGTPDEIARELIDSLDRMWCCHYCPHLNNLEEQYGKAIS